MQSLAYTSNNAILPYKYCRDKYTSFKLCEHLVEEFQESWVNQVPFVVLIATCNRKTYVKIL